MFGFSTKNHDLRALNQRLGKLLNSLHRSDLEAEKQRAESRVRLAKPCIIFLYKEARSPKSYAIGITSDISLHGVSLFAQDAIENEDCILMFGDGDSRILVRAACKRCVRDKFGLYSVGFEFSKLLRENDYPAIIHAATGLDAPEIASSPAVDFDYPQYASSLD